MGLEREEIKIPHSLSQFSHPKKPNIFLRWQMKSHHGTNAALLAALCLGVQRTPQAQGNCTNTSSSPAHSDSENSLPWGDVISLLLGQTSLS